MKWFRIMLATFLIVGVLICVSSIAYADDGEDANPPPGEDNPGDSSGLNVDIAVVGDNADVGVDVIGDDSEVAVNTTGTEVWINGQNLNEPTAVYNVRNYSSGGVAGGWVKKQINQAVSPLYSWAEETAPKLGLTADGLAKVILVIKDHDSQLTDTSADMDDLYARQDGIDGDLARIDSNLESIDNRLASLEEKHDTLIRKVTIMSRAFLLVVTGLGIGLGISIRRLQKRKYGKV